DFQAFPLPALADAALQRAADLGAAHADLRVQRVRESVLRLRDGHLSTSTDSTDSGLAVRVLVDGVWGFAATTRSDAGHAAATAELAVQMARISRPLVTQRVDLADEPVHADAEWVSDYADDPFDVPIADRVGLLATWSAELLDDDAVDH